MKTRKREFRCARRGMVLPLIIGIAVVLAILGIGFMQMGFGSRLMAAVTMSQISARAAADAGLTRAIYAMNMWYRDPVVNPQPVNGSGTLADPYANYNYLVSPVGPLLYQIDSTGTSGRETRLVHAFATMTSRFEYALFVTNNITMKEGASIDGYDSRRGPYIVPSNSGLPVQIGSNTTMPKTDDPREGIELGQGISVVGDVAVGPGADAGYVITGQGEDEGIAGLPYSMSEPYQWAEIEVPTVYQDARERIAFNSGTQSIGIGGTITTAQIIRCAVLDIGTGGVLEVSGDVQLRVTQRITLLGNNNEIRIMPGSSLRIYLDGSFDSGNSTFFNVVTADPKRFILYGTGSSEQSWTVRYGGNFYGVIYAPNANLIVDASGDIYGAIAAKSCDLRNDGSLHYDQALADPSIFPAGYVIIRWWETMGP